VEGLDWEDGDLLMLGSSRLAPPRRLFISTAARILRVLEVPMVVTLGEEQSSPGDD
jgi:nucleotide-binding universal stress UspA family protein